MVMGNDLNRVTLIQSFSNLLHNLILPNLLLVTPSRTGSNNTCAHSCKRVFFVVVLFTVILALTTLPNLAQLLALRQLLEGVALVTLRTGVQSRRCHSRPTEVTELEEDSRVQLQIERINCAI